VDLYAYGGAEGAMSKLYGATGGHGNPNVNPTGCAFEPGTCNASASSVVEGTIGGWWRLLRSNWGTIQAGAQYECVVTNVSLRVCRYEHVARNIFQEAGPAKGSTVSPSANDTMVLVSVRYLPFQ